MATLEEFKKLELIVAQIKEVNDHPDADRLYLLKLDTGTGEKQVFILHEVIIGEGKINSNRVGWFLMKNALPERSTKPF